MNFRRWITALAVLTLFVGLAAAQTSGGGTALTCNTIAQVTPTIRAEGITEEVGDIVITCQGGTYTALNTAIPQGNIVVSLSLPVTSRLASGSAPAGAAGQPSEAILMVDEPNSGLQTPVPGFGPAASLQVCPTPGTGCVEYATSVATGTGNYVVATNTQNPTTPAPGYNVFQGNVSNNVVSFQGVPFLPPVTNGVVRVYRITNIRVNATQAGSSIVSGVTPVTAFISTNGASTLPINSASYNGITVGFVGTSLNPSVSNAKTTFTQCLGQSQALVATLHFAEYFPSAFKTRIAPFGTTGTSYIGTSSAIGYPQQSIPGQLYGSESNFILPVNGVQAGLADFGTRLKATFNNLPTGATIYVSMANTNAGTGVVGGANAPQPSIAYLTTGGDSGVFTGTTTSPYPLAPVSGTATAVWEVINTNTSANEDFQFGVYITYGTNNPPVPATTGSPTVTLTYAPISSKGSATSGDPIPRFIQGANSTAQGLNVVVGPCQTILLFPYVTSQLGYDTGLAISNTSTDPFSTANSAGACTIYFYGTNAPAAYVTPSIASGGQWADTAYVRAPNFGGYVFAVCNFQFAHGFAFVSDYGARNIAMGYLALIVNNGAAQQNFRGITANVPSEVLEN